jgi:hypothetical protein
MQVRTEANITTSVRVLNDHDRPPRKYSSGRVCAEPYCGTRLSVYNGREFCALHRTDVARRTRGRSVDQVGPSISVGVRRVRGLRIDDQVPVDRRGTR